MAAVPVLTYHGARAGKARYAENDHLTLAEDLRRLNAAGWRVVSLHQVVEAFLAGTLDSLRRCVALTFDDGTDFDWRDIEHPVYGWQRGFAGILADFGQAVGCALPPATAFVIASPEARGELDRNTLHGSGWWTENWWLKAVRANLAVENHSWDHNHELVHGSPRSPADRGTFRTIDTWAECDRQVRQAADYIDDHLAPHHRCRLYAHPYGEYSHYLVRHYLPEYMNQHRQIAAFATQGEPLHAGADRWCLPRFVCGNHWRSTTDFDAILRDCT